MRPQLEPLVQEVPHHFTKLRLRRPVWHISGKIENISIKWFLTRNLKELNIIGDTNKVS